MDSVEIRKVAQLLKCSERVLFITGAGLSADSGLPTYRGVGGLYDNGDTEEGLPIEMALSGQMFRRRPDITWKYLWQVGEACAGVEPNSAHRFMARLEQEKSEVWVLTQNVDGLHRRAGTRNLIEAHGHGFDLFCTRCRKQFDASQLIGSYQTRMELPPRCPDCSGVIRPDVILFDEVLSDAAHEGLKRLARTPFEIIFSVGTSALFSYIAGPILAAYSKGIPSVEVNPGETDLSDVFRYRIPLTAAAAFDAIQREMDTLAA